MRLHDPGTERKVIRLARTVAEPTGFLKSGSSFWMNLLRRVSVCVALVYVAAIVCSLMEDSPPDDVERRAIYTILLMALLKIGSGKIAMAFQSAGFFNTLANLPIHGRTALTHIRGIALRKFWFLSLAGAFAASVCIHYPLQPGKSQAILATGALLATIVWTTLGITQTEWFHRLRIVKLWHWAAYAVIAYILVLRLFGGYQLIPEAGRAAMDRMVAGILWIFPPTWVLPGAAGSEGLIPAAIWIAAGLWCWIRWPHILFPRYDRPMDFPGAFGDVGTAVEPELEPAEADNPGAGSAENLPREAHWPARGWVERVIRATLPASDRTVASAFSPETNHTRRVILCMVFAAAWLLVIRLFEIPFLRGSGSAIYFFSAWVVPMIVFVPSLLPIHNPLKAALEPCPVGNTPVPFFTTLPVPLRSLLRITLRTVMVRTLIAVLIATPFFWMLSKSLGLTEASRCIALVIPTVGAAWIVSVPVLLTHRIDPHLRRRKGIFPLILATSLAQVPIGFLWILGSFAGIGLAVAWSLEGAMGTYSFLMLPGSLVCLAFSAVMSRLVFEILHLSLRQRRYEWKSKIR